LQGFFSERSSRRPPGCDAVACEIGEQTGAPCVFCSAAGRPAGGENVSDTGVDNRAMTVPSCSQGPSPPPVERLDDLPAESFGV
jgi:hypothetical protein